uniref:hypothetical protein n=1 Tax=uncultured Psychrobacter sp. TaxID=259303 RepID=UPI0026281C82|nr:hypothetical protein [uncultured Psychrobacter sp.]
MISIESLTINVNSISDTVNESVDMRSPVIVRDELVELLRIISKDQRFFEQTVVIPDDCEQYGFTEGEFDLPKLLHFLADMLE